MITRLWVVKITENIKLFKVLEFESHFRYFEPTDISKFCWKQSRGPHVGHQLSVSALISVGNPRLRYLDFTHILRLLWQIVDSGFAIKAFNAVCWRHMLWTARAWNNSTNNIILCCDTDGFYPQSRPLASCLLHRSILI